MPAYWLTYKTEADSPERGWPLNELRLLIARVETDRDAPGATEWWRIANRTATPGERVYLFKQGSDPRGIFGVGTIVQHPEMRNTVTDSKMQWRAEIKFERLVDPTIEFLLPFHAIDDVLPRNLVNAQSSGTRVPSEVEAEIERRLLGGIFSQAIGAGTV